MVSYAHDQGGVMEHAYHPDLPGYDPRQVMFDGCPECEQRATDPALAIASFDDRRFLRAWERAELNAGLDTEGELGPVSKCERGVLRILWAVRQQLRNEAVPW